MAASKGILIYNKNDQERNSLNILMKTSDNQVFSTSDALEALNVLQKEDIGVILAGSDIKGMTNDEFKLIVEKIRPDVSTLFISPFILKDKDFKVNIAELFKLINDLVRQEGIMKREISEVKQFAYAIADRLLQIFAVNDRYFFNNDHLVSELSGGIAVRMGLDDNLVEAVRMAALLRDLGRVVIHQQILEETKKLNQFELTPIKAHPTYTMQILRQVSFPWNLDSIISQHHEHYDGTGYPLELKGREITIGARIINVVDAYYAMTTDRPYRKALTKEKAMEEIKKGAGSQFDPEVVEVFLSLIREEVEENGHKKIIVIFARETNIAAMIKLSTASELVEVIHTTSSIETISQIRHKSPQLIIADAGALEPETFARFYHTVRQIVIYSHRFLLIVPDKGILKNFDHDIDYIVKPLNIDQLSAKIRTLLFETTQPAVQEGFRGLTGDIKDFNITDIIQILSIGLKTAKVELDRENEKGILYLLRGKIVHVSTGKLRGPEAFFDLIRWDNGTFYIVHGETTNDINVTLDTMHLLMEAVNVLDEKNAFKPGNVQVSSTQ